MVTTSKQTQTIDFFLFHFRRLNWDFPFVDSFNSANQNYIVCNLICVCVYFPCLFFFFFLPLLSLFPFTFAHFDSHSVRFRIRSHCTQQPIALLKLLFEKGGMFDRSRDLNWKRLKDVLYFGAMSTPGGDRCALDKRFVSLCLVYHVPLPGDGTVFNIFASILRGHLSDFDAELLPISDQLIKITSKLFQVKVARMPSPDWIPSEIACAVNAFTYYLRLFLCFPFFFLYCRLILNNNKKTENRKRKRKRRDTFAAGTDWNGLEILVARRRRSRQCVWRVSLHVNRVAASLCRFVQLNCRRHHPSFIIRLI